MAADRVVREILLRATVLQDQPAMGRPGRIVGTRELILADSGYILAYRVGEQHVDVLTILHGRQQWPEQL